DHRSGRTAAGRHSNQYGVRRRPLSRDQEPRRRRGAGEFPALAAGRGGAQSEGHGAGLIAVVANRRTLAHIDKKGEVAVAEDAIPIGRRISWLGAAPAAAAFLPPRAGAAQAPAAGNNAPPDAEPLLTLTQTEHAFFVAAADTLIPADALSPSGSQCGVA